MAIGVFVANPPIGHFQSLLLGNATITPFNNPAKHRRMCHLALRLVAWNFQVRSVFFACCGIVTKSLPVAYILATFAVILLFEFLPYVEEFVRGYRMNGGRLVPPLARDGRPGLTTER